MHYDRSSIVLMMGKMLKREIFKSWDELFVILVMWTILIQAQKNRKGLIIYYKTYIRIILKKHVNVNHAIIAIFLRKGSIV
jgi:hypothetical protein